MKKSTKTLKTPATPAALPVQQHASDLLTVAEVAVILRVDATTIRRWVKDGALEAVVLPHSSDRQAYRIKRETLETLLGKSRHAR